MRNIANYLSYLPKKLSLIVLSLGLLALPVIAAQASVDHPPRFNIYEDVQFGSTIIGDESDFLRVGPTGIEKFDVSSFSDPFNVCEGQAEMWVYIHNGQDADYNGAALDGEAVARDTKVQISLPGGEDNSLTSTATISASNADSVVDSATINCGDHKVKISYVPGSATGYSQQRGDFAISDSIVTSAGVPIGTFADDGIVPGCWEYRVWVKITVEIEKEEIPEPIVKCEALNSIFVDRDTRKLEATSFVENATVVSYDFDFGDGATETVTTDALTATTGEHDYAPGNYTATVAVNFDTDGDGQADTTKNCVTQIEVEEEPLKPLYTCDALSMEMLGKNSYRFTADATAENGATILGYEFYVNNSSVQDSTSNTYDFTENTPGTYTVRVDVAFDVNGETKVVSSPACEKTVEIEEEPPEPIYTCDAISVIEQDDKFEFTVSATALHGATIVEYMYWVNGEKVLTVNDNTFELDKAPGTYKVQAEVVFNVDGQLRTVTSDDCATEVEVPEEPIFTCDVLELISSEEKRFVFEGSHTAENGAEFVEYNFYVNDKLIQESTDPEFILEPAEAGTYEVVLKAVFNVNGETIAVTSDACQQTVEVEEEPEPIFECTAVNTIVNSEKKKVVVTVETKAENGAEVKHYLYNFGDNTGEVMSTEASRSHIYEKDGTYQIDVVVVFNVNDEMVNVHCGDKITIDTEVLPAKELPNTGPVSAIAGLFGTGALGMTFRNWAASRKDLRKKLLGSK